MKHFKCLDIYEDWTSDPKCGFTELKSIVPSDLVSQTSTNSMSPMPARRAINTSAACHALRFTSWDWGDDGNLVFGNVRGWCYQCHSVSTREFHGHAALVGAIIRGVYKDAFLAELIALAKEKGKPLNKNDFMSIQAFSR